MQQVETLFIAIKSFYLKNLPKKFKQKKNNSFKQKFLNFRLIQPVNEDSVSKCFL